MNAHVENTHFNRRNTALLDHPADADSLKAALRTLGGGVSIITAGEGETRTGATVTGVVKTVDARGAEIQLADDVIGYLRASEISRDRVEDARNVLKEGDEVTALIINVDRKTRGLQLSIKAKDNAEQQEALQRLSAESTGNAGTTSLGALLKAKLDNQSNN